MLIDEVELIFKAGHGGPGKASFYPAKKAGPDGGNGGRGGDIYLRVTSDLTALNRFSREKSIKAEDGEMGGNNKRSGQDGDPLFISLPIGTSVINKDTGNEIIELNDLNQEFLICKGGLGGRGNYELRSSRMTTPIHAQKGLPGEEKPLKLILKLIADFGLIGLPSAGKSSLLNELTAANVKTGEYHFTTLEPNLGVLQSSKGPKIVADIPGLIEGASEGRGLGIKFLKHIEKVKIILHCISCESENPLDDYKVVRSEMEKFNPELLKKEEVILLSKTDLVEKKIVLEKVKILKKLKRKILPVSIYDFDSLENLKKILIEDYH